MELNLALDLNGMSLVSKSFNDAAELFGSLMDGAGLGEETDVDIVVVRDEVSLADTAKKRSIADEEMLGEQSREDLIAELNSVKRFVAESGSFEGAK